MKRSTWFLLFVITLLACPVFGASSAYAVSALKWTDVSVGDYHTMGMTSDGTLWAWGCNMSGALGDGTYIHKYMPKKVMTGVKYFCAASGSNLSIAITKDMSLWVWGNNHQFQVGNGGKGDGVTKPYRVLKKVIAAAPMSASCVYAVTQDNTLWYWGLSDDGLLLAMPESSIAKKPVKVGKINNVKQLYAEYNVLYVLKTDNSLWVLGTGGQNTNLTLDKLTMLLPNVRKITISPIGNTVAVCNDGSVWAWKYDKTALTPTKIASNAVDATCYTYYQKDRYNRLRQMYTYAILRKDGYITFADDTLADLYVGESVKVDGNYSGSTFVLRKDGSLWSWGDNEYGQLGNGTNTDLEASAITQVGAPVSTKPKSVSMSPKSATIYIGESMTFTAYVNPAGAEQGLTWKSSKASVATVQNGVVTGVSAGKATITAESTANKKIKATRAVTVKANALYRSKPLSSKSKRVYTSARSLSYSGDNVSCQMYVCNMSGTSIVSLRNLNIYFFNKDTKVKILVNSTTMPIVLAKGRYTVLPFNIPKALVGTPYLDRCEVFATGEYITSKGKVGLVSGVGVI